MNRLLHLQYKSKLIIAFCLFTFGIFSIGFSQKSNITKVLVLPDTQTYLEGFPEEGDTVFNWIAAHSKDYAAVVQLGDLTQDNHPLEWYTMSRFFKRFEDKNLPYTFCLGNHDMGSRPGKAADTRNTTNANKYFPVSRVSKQKVWGGCYNNKIDNNYILFSAGGIDWLIISLSFGPSDKVLQWANEIADKYSNRKVIVSTHAYMYDDNTRMRTGDVGLPQSYGIGKDTTDTVNDGEQMWSKFVSRHANIIAVVSGHVTNAGVGTLVSTGEHGNKVYQMLSNYQRGVTGSVRGGNGYVRLLTFDKKNHTLKVDTISVLTGQHHPSSLQNFTFNNVEF